MPWEWIEGESYNERLEENFKTVERDGYIAKMIKGKSMTLKNIHQSQPFLIYCGLVDSLGGILKTAELIEVDPLVNEFLKISKAISIEEKIAKYTSSPWNIELSKNFVDLKYKDINEKNVIGFLKRVDRFDKERVNALLLMLYADEEERRNYNDFAALQFGYIYGALLDIVLAKDNFKPDGDFISFLRKRVVTKQDRVITGLWSEESQESLVKFIKYNYPSLKNEIRGLGASHKNNPGECIKMVLKMFDVRVELKGAYWNLGKKLWESYEAHGLKKTWKYDKKIDWISNYVHGKLNAGIPLNARDEAFLIKKERAVIAKITKPIYPLEALNSAVFFERQTHSG